MGLAVRAQIVSVGAMSAVLALAGCGSSSDTNEHRDAISPPAERSKDADAEEKQREAVNGEVGKSVLEGEPRACTPSAPIPSSEFVDLLPKGLAPPEGSMSIGKIDEPTHVTLTFQLDEADRTASPTSLRARYQAELEAAGYVVTGGDDEGHESEVFFTLPDGGKGVVQSIRSDCPADTVRVIISYAR